MTGSELPEVPVEARTQQVDPSPIAATVIPPRVQPASRDPQPFEGPSRRSKARSPMSVSCTFSSWKTSTAPVKGRNRSPLRPW